MLLERWALQYVRGAPPGPGGAGGSFSGARTYLDEASVYKRMVRAHACPHACMHTCTHAGHQLQFHVFLSMCILAACPPACLPARGLIEATSAIA